MNKNSPNSKEASEVNATDGVSTDEARAAVGGARSAI
jgi:hypothetical protein